MAVHDLGFGFILELSQLLAQARDSLVKLLNMEVEGINLLAQSRLKNTDFASRIEQVFEQFGIDARKFLPCFLRTNRPNVGRRFRLRFWRRLRCRFELWLGLGPWRGLGLWVWLGLRVRLRVGLRLGLGLGSRLRLGFRLRLRLWRTRGVRLRLRVWFG